MLQGLDKKEYKVYVERLQPSKGMGPVVSGYEFVEGTSEEHWTGEGLVGSVMEIHGLNPRELERGDPSRTSRARRADLGWQLLKQSFPVQQLLTSTTLGVSSHQLTLGCSGFSMPTTSHRATQM